MSAGHRLPSHPDTAHIGIKVEQGSDANGFCHDVVQLRPLGWVQVEHAENEIPQARAVAIRDGCKGPAHNLQD